MGKIGKLRKKFTAFVNQLSPDQVREQLVLAYLQMEQTQRVLRGENVEPLTMLDNGESSDLELFYQCKKSAEELAYLNQVVSKPKVDVKFGFASNEQVERLKKIAESFRELGMKLQPRQLIIGKEVFFLSKGRIHKSILEDFIGIVQDETGDVVCRVKGYENAIPARFLYSTPEELAHNIGKKVQNHYSFSKDHESAYFIDSTSRVFKGAKWYLGERRITFHETIENLRECLLQETNIIDDTKK